MTEYIKLLHGDCLELMKDIPDKSVDLTVTSPPYDNLRSYNGNKDKWNASVWKSVITDLFRITKDGGVVVWVVADATIKGSETGTSFRQALHFIDVGFNLHDTMIWEKDSFTYPDKTRYRQCFEYMFVFSKGKPKSINKISDRKNKFGGTVIKGTTRAPDGATFRKSNHNKSVVKEYGERFNVWHIPTEKNNKTGHPAVFPIQIALDHIISWSNEGDTVLDCFMGSGTTGVACVNTNRNFIGIELDDEYYGIAKARIDAALAEPVQPRTLEVGE